ncbi:uncharacterized protein LOC113358807 [Papaver somniferum]|uniref:uncharacterized protein LOC113358807 n=1 Tax=Papaver somniferum TaxID=3469 RepID=UPI000E6FA352|nr:uncharacterized protein LOC113358807 [Papaver somniferum]
MVSDRVFLVRFEREDEMHRELAVATRVFYGDLCCIKIWERTENLTTWSPSVKMFFITIHNLTQAQISSENLRRYIACMRDISSFSYLVRNANGSYSITVRASIRYKQRLCYSVFAENEMGYTNEIWFQFHHFQNNYCDYCKLIGHKFQNCEQQMFDQQQAEQQQSAADAIMAAMQQIDEQQHEPMVDQQLENP